MEALLEGKSLLMLGGASYTPFVKLYAEKMGFHLFAAGNEINEEMNKYVEDYYIAEASNVEEICELVNNKKFDGIIALGNEDIIDCVTKVAPRCNIPFYINEDNWNNLQNKENFKLLCKKFGIDIVEEYKISNDIDMEDLGILPYPVVFKPVDSCGSKGITICYNSLDVCAAIEKARKFSRSNEYIIEKYMKCPEFIVSYIFADGNIYVWMLGDRYMNTQQKGLGALSNLSIYPSRFSQQYMEKIHPRMEKLLKEYGPKDGTLFIQGFIDDEKIRFFDPGLRFCGTLDTIIYSEVCDINPLHWMINHSLTGSMTTKKELEKMDWKLNGKVCAQLSILVNPGTISRIVGLEAVKKLDGVISVVQLLHEGDTVDMVGTLQQVLVRIHMVKENRKQIQSFVDDIYKLVNVTNELGEDMKMPFVIDYEI